MIQHVFQPVLYVLALFAATGCLSRYPVLVSRLRLAGATVLCTAAMLMSLEYNRQQVTKTAAQKQFITTLFQTPALSACPAKNVVLFLEGLTYLPVNTFAARMYVRSHAKCGNRNVAIVSKERIVDQIIGYRSAVMGANEHGVLMRCDRGVDTFTTVPYKDLALFRCSGSEVTEMITCPVNSLVGYNVVLGTTAAVIPTYHVPYGVR
jgi:hypothetical protein